MTGPVVPSETERLSFRRFTPADIEALGAIFGDPEVMAPIGDGKPMDGPALAGFVDFIEGQYRANGFGPWAVVGRADGRIIGLSGIKRAPHLRHVDFGFAFHRSLWGRGLATEAGRAVFDHAFTILREGALSAVVKPENRRSVRVLEKLGMRPAGRVVHQGLEQDLYLIAAPRSSVSHCG